MGCAANAGRCGLRDVAAGIQRGDGLIEGGGDMPRSGLFTAFRRVSNQRSKPFPNFLQKGFKAVFVPSLP